MNKIADYPEHPNSLVIKKNEFFSNGVHEIDIWNYYSGIKSKLVPLFKGKDLFIVISTKLGSKIFIRHPYDKKSEFIRINSDAEFETYHSGRTVEYHITSPLTTDELVFDTDPGPSATFEQIKSVAELCEEFVKKQKDFSKSIEIRFTGSRGFHIETHLKTKRKISDIKNDVEKRLDEYFKDNKDIVVATNKPSGSKINIDLSPMKVNGGHVATYSMRESTGLCCVPVKNLKSFKKEDAKFDKVYQQITGKKFKFEDIKKGYLEVLTEINKFGFVKI